MAIPIRKLLWHLHAPDIRAESLRKVCLAKVPMPCRDCDKKRNYLGNHALNQIRQLRKKTMRTIWDKAFGPSYHTKSEVNTAQNAEFTKINSQLET
jgi:hypothetical protein